MQVTTSPHHHITRYKLAIWQKVVNRPISFQYAVSIMHGHRVEPKYPNTKIQMMARSLDGHG